MFSTAETFLKIVCVSYDVVLLFIIINDFSTVFILISGMLIM